MAIVPEYETEGTVWNNSDSCDDIARGAGRKACHVTSSQPFYIYIGGGGRRSATRGKSDTYVHRPGITTTNGPTYVNTHQKTHSYHMLRRTPRPRSEPIAKRI